MKVFLPSPPLFVVHVLFIFSGCYCNIRDLTHTKLIYSKHFIIEYSPLYENSIDEFIRIAESTFTELKELFGEAPRKRIKANFFTGYDVYRWKGTVRNISGEAIKGKFYVQGYYEDKDKLTIPTKGVIRHELVHIFCMNLLKERCENLKQFEEGLALLYGEGDWLNSLLDVTSPDSLPSIYSSRSTNLSMYSGVLYLMEKYGKEKLKFFLKLLRELSFEDAFTECFSQTFVEFENDWREWLKQRDTLYITDIKYRDYERDSLIILISTNLSVEHESLITIASKVFSKMTNDLNIKSPSKIRIKFLTRKQLYYELQRMKRIIKERNRQIDTLATPFLIPVFDSSIIIRREIVKTLSRMFWDYYIDYKYFSTNLRNRNLIRSGFIGYITSYFCPWVDSLGNQFPLNFYLLKSLAQEDWTEFKSSQHIAIEKSKRFVQFYYEIYGKEKFVELLHKLKPDVSFNTAIKKVLGISIEELENRFDEWLEEKILL